MLKHLITLSTLISVANGACFDNGDKEIGGLCYSFISEKLTFNDARNWCHYKNPVTASFLAYVPNMFASNFLATYARPSFGENEGAFWIGLSRNESGSPWFWDSGDPMVFTNFGAQLTGNYAAESVVNGKWSAFGTVEKYPFVCSYNPSAPPTFSPDTSAGPVSTTQPVTTLATTTQNVPTTTGKCAGVEASCLGVSACVIPCSVLFYVCNCTYLKCVITDVENNPTRGEYAYHQILQSYR